METISICICTFNRNKTLLFLLEKLIEQSLQGDLNYEIIIVDNDRAGGAKDAVRKIQDNNTNINIIYDIEPIQNIALARNRTIMHISGEFVAFIDDDEYPSDNWLAELYDTLRCTESDAVMGPVIPVFQDDTPDWIIKSKFFERPNPPDQSPLNYGRTGNVLIRSVWFKKLLFNQKYGLTGGEDSDFFRRMLKLGGKIVWSKKGYVFERVDPARICLSWILARAYRGGQGTAAKKFPSLLKKGIILHFLYRFSLVIVSVLVAIFCFPFSTGNAAWWLTKTASNIGQLSIIHPHRYEEYSS